LRRSTRTPAHFELALVFLGIFFSIFYATKLVQTKLAESDADLTENLVSTVVTTMIFYAMCFAIATNASLGIFQCWTLFTYLAVFSIAMIASSLAIQKRIFVFYSGSLFTWAIFCGWFATSYTSDVHFPLALTFLGIFLAVLYGAALIQSRILSYEKDLTGNLITSLLTCCVFFIICFAIGTNSSLATLQRWTFFTYLAVFSIALIASALAIQKRIFVFYSASLFIWAIFCAWFATSYSFEEHFRLALTFLGIFFAVLYGASLIQSRVLADENDLNGNFGASLLHAFVFYAMCYAVMITALPGPGTILVSFHISGRRVDRHTRDLIQVLWPGVHVPCCAINMGNLRCLVFRALLTRVLCTYRDVYRAVLRDILLFDPLSPARRG
jgi:hypothetical protein